MTETREPYQTNPSDKPVRYRVYLVSTGDVIREHNDAMLLARWAQKKLAEPWGMLTSDFDTVQPRPRD